MPKVALLNIGCKVNQAELEELALELKRSGVGFTRDPGEADLCVLNTCTVTTESDRKCRKTLNSLTIKGFRLVVAGCFAQRFREELLNRPGVAAVVTNEEKSEWASKILNLIADLPEGDKREISTDEGVHRYRARGFLKVQEGCERRCSYCIVPLVRGRERSVNPQEVVKKAAELLKEGVEELVICGTNLGRYSWKGMDLGDLVEVLCDVSGSFRIRLSSIEPEDFQVDWIRRWRETGRVCPHLHLPLQSGSRRILEDMGRGYGPEDYLDLWECVSREWPGCVLTTEVIVGYPGEGKEEFQETEKLLSSIKPAKLHVFRYSPRPGTRASFRTDQIPTEKKIRRSRRLIGLGLRWRQEYMEKRIGTPCWMVVEEIMSRGSLIEARGTTEDYLRGRIILGGEEPFPFKPGSLAEGVILGVKDQEVLIRPTLRRGGQ